MDPELTQAFTLLLLAVRKLGVHVFFVRGEGEICERWPESLEEPGQIPTWLGVEPGAVPELPPASGERLSSVDQPKFSETLFGHHGIWSKASAHGALAHWRNQWQMIEVGLLLRALGHNPVRVQYSGAAVTRAGRGVEEKMRDEMLALFGVELVWDAP
jgi:hypothetical protein